MEIIRNIGLLAACKPVGGQADIHALPAAALAWENGKIAWVGREEYLPPELRQLPAIDAQGKLLIPGLVDCHTHLVFAGSRAQEFMLRLQGKSYLEILKAGGGIHSTVRATREATEEMLFEKALFLLKKFPALGVTTIEAKSGYGLTLEAEKKILRVHKRLQSAQPLTLVSTFMGAHALPEEYAQDRRGYLRLLTEEMIPAVAAGRLAEFCDVFAEDGAFTAEEAREILEAGKRHGLAPKIHADQLHDGGGAALAAAVDAVSADHLEFVSEAGVKELSESRVIAVLLPFSSMFTLQSALNARRLIDAEVPVAVATNFNPGTAPSYHLPLAMLLACTLNRLTPAEALKAATIYGAMAINREFDIGSLEPGKAADFALIDAPDVATWLYHFNANSCISTWKNGVKIYAATTA